MRNEELLRVKPSLPDVIGFMCINYDNETNKCNGVGVRRVPFSSLA